MIKAKKGDLDRLECQSKKPRKRGTKIPVDLKLEVLKEVMVDGHTYEFISQKHQISKQSISILAKKAYEVDGFVEELIDETDQ